MMCYSSFLLTSCFYYQPLISYKDVKKGNVTEMMASAKPGEVYSLHLKNGEYVDKLKVIRIERGNILGKPLRGKTLIGVNQDQLQSMKLTGSDLSEIRNEIKPNGHYLFFLNNGKQLKMKVVRIENGILDGKTKGVNDNIEIAMAEIEYFETRNTSFGGPILAIVIPAVLIYVIIKSMSDSYVALTMI